MTKSSLQEKERKIIRNYSYPASASTRGLITCESHWETEYGELQGSSENSLLGTQIACSQQLNYHDRKDLYKVVENLVKNWRLSIQLESEITSLNIVKLPPMESPSLGHKIDTSCKIC